MAASTLNPIPLAATPEGKFESNVAERDTTNAFVSIGEASSLSAAKPTAEDSPVPHHIYPSLESYSTASYSDQAHYALYIDDPVLAAAKTRKFSEWNWRPTMFERKENVGGEARGTMELINRTPAITPKKTGPKRGSRGVGPLPSLRMGDADHCLRRAQSVGDDGFTASPHVSIVGSAKTPTTDLVLRNATAEGIDDLLQGSNVVGAVKSVQGVSFAEETIAASPAGDEGDVASDSDSCESSASEHTVGDGEHTRKFYHIPTSNKGPEYFAHRHTDAKKKLLIIMVGLPAQGKTFLAQKVCRLLGWNGCRSQVINLQVAWRHKIERNVRRTIRRNASFASGILPPSGNGGNHSTSIGGQSTPGFMVSPVGALPTSGTSARAYSSPVDTFPVGGMGGQSGSGASVTNGAFPLTATQSVTPASGTNGGQGGASPRHNSNTPALIFKEFLTNPDSYERKVYTQILNEQYKVLEDFYTDGGQVTILNDDFPTKALRQEAAKLFEPLVDNIMYIEVRRNTSVNLDLLKMQAEYSAKSMMSSNAILDDFQSRIQLMQSVYEPLDPSDPTMAYVRLLDSSILEAHHLTGFLQSRIVSFLMNLTQVKISHPIYFCRHGQSEFNLDDRLGGDPNLTVKGRADAEALFEFIKSLKEDLDDPLHHLQGTPRLLQLSRPMKGVPPYAMEASQAGMVANGSGDAGVTSPTTAIIHIHSRADSGVSLMGPDSPNKESGETGAAAIVQPSPFVMPTSAQHGDHEGHSGTGPNSRSLSGVHHSSSSTQQTPQQQHHSDPNTGGHHSLYAAQRKQLQNRSLEIWTSQLRRAIQTAMPAEKRLGLKTLRLHSLNEIHAGVCENMTYSEVKEVYPLIHRFRGEDKFAFRYPGGESYQDLVARLEPVIMELENANRVVVVVAHQAVLRGLLAYFGSTSADECVNVEVPHRTVWRCTYDAQGISQMHSVKLGPKEASPLGSGTETQT